MRSGRALDCKKGAWCVSTARGARVQRAARVQRSARDAVGWR